MVDLVDKAFVDSLLVQSFEIDGVTDIYTDEEISYILKERDRLFLKFIEGKTPSEKGNDKWFVLTAGGPGAGKTHLVESLIEQKDALLSNCIYVDPDETIMRDMVRFKQDVASRNVEYAHTKWRLASQYIWNDLLNKAAERGYNIVNGTTATGPHVEAQYKNVKAAGYQIMTLAVYAPIDQRLKSAEVRYEVTGERHVPAADVLEKGRLFVEKVPLYLRYSDRVDFFFREDWNASACGAVRFQKNQGVVTLDDASAKKLYKSFNQEGGNLEALLSSVSSSVRKNKPVKKLRM